MTRKPYNMHSRIDSMLQKQLSKGYEVILKKEALYSGSSKLAEYLHDIDDLKQRIPEAQHCFL